MDGPLPDGATRLPLPGPPRALREAVIRVVVPLDRAAISELPETKRELGALPGERVLDLASPKLLAVQLARAGVEVVSGPARVRIDWRKLTAREPRLTLQWATRAAVRGRELRARGSVSVLEHIPEPGDEASPARAGTGDEARRPRGRHAAACGRVSRGLARGARVRRPPRPGGRALGRHSSSAGTTVRLDRLAARRRSSSSPPRP